MNLNLELIVKKKMSDGYKDDLGRTKRKRELNIDVFNSP